METLDVGKLDDRYFLTEVTLPQTIASVDIEGMYRISPSAGGSISIRNLGTVTKKESSLSDAKDGLLEVVITPQAENGGSWLKKKPMEETRIMITHGQIISPEPVEVHADHHVVNGMNFVLGMVPKKLRIITGRGRRVSTGEKG